MKWDRKSIYLFISLSLFHLIILLINYETIDWKIQWYSSVEIVEGLPLFAQNTRQINGEAIFKAMHFPVFFYSMAIMIKLFGSYQVVGKIFLWITTNLLALVIIELTEPSTERELQIVIILFFANPLLLMGNILSLFDTFTLLYYCLALYFATRDRPFLTAILLVIGIYTKFFPAFGFAVIFIYYLRQRKIKENVVLSGTFVSMTLGILYALYYVYRNYLIEILRFQFTRNTPNTSVWYTFLEGSIEPDVLLGVQLIVMILVSLYLLSYPVENSQYHLLAANSVYLATFIILLRNSYPHYGIWYNMFLIPVMTKLYVNKSFKTFYLIVASILIYFSAGVICLFSCFDDPNPIMWLVYITSIVQFVGCLLVYPIAHKLKDYNFE